MRPFNFNKLIQTLDVHNKEKEFLFPNLSQAPYFQKVLYLVL